MIEVGLHAASKTDILSESMPEILEVEFECTNQKIGVANLAVYEDHIDGEVDSTKLDPQFGQKGILHFRLLGKVWTHHTQLTATKKISSEVSAVRFSLSKASRPGFDSRLSKRWSNHPFRPIVGQLLNDLAAGQLFTCQIRDISIGGAQLEFTESPAVFVGQETQLEIFYPLSLESIKNKIKVVAIDSVNSNPTARVRFTPITSQHINALANHLIKFQFDTPVSKLELDLSETPLPQARVAIDIRKIGNTTYAATGLIQGEEIFNAGITIDEEHKAIVLSQIGGTTNWSNNEYLELLLPTLTTNWRPGEKSEQLIIEQALKNLWFLGFRKNDIGHWQISLRQDNLSVLQQYQNRAFTFSQVEDRPPRTTIEKTFNSYERFRPKEEKTAVSWDKYGLVYDIMCEANSSYQLLLTEYRDWLTAHHNEIDTALDIGAGTGNFVIEAARALPLAQIDHIDLDNIMNFFAQDKYAREGIENVRVSTIGVDELAIEQSQYDLVTTIHSIYTLPDPQKALLNIYNWLKPGGLFYVVDIGRTIDTNEWSKFIFMDCIKKRGLKQTLQTFWDGRAAITQNKKIQATQDSGTYWNRPHDEFVQTLIGIGFEVIKSEITYRGNSDRAICRKPE